MPTPPHPTPLSKYVITDTWVSKWSVTVGGEATDALTFTARVERPDTTGYDLEYGTGSELVRTGAGVYQIIVPMTSTGRWKLRVEYAVLTDVGTISRTIEWWAECTATKLSS